MRFPLSQSLFGPLPSGAVMGMATVYAPSI
jgi:hypothetical protein